MIATIIKRDLVITLGCVLRVVLCMGRHWMVGGDVASCLSLKPTAVKGRLAKNQRTFAGQYLKARVEGFPAASLLLSEEGVRLFVAGMKTKTELGSELIAWLDAGGMKIDQQPPAPEVETLPVEEVELLPPPRHVPSLRLVPRGPDPMQQLLEREKAYCRDLVKTFLRYCESEEVDKLTGMIDGQIDHLLETRFCPGLNAARYELYRKYWMQGGGV